MKAMRKLLRRGSQPRTLTKHLHEDLSDYMHPTGYCMPRDPCRRVESRTKPTSKVRRQPSFSKPPPASSSTTVQRESRSSSSMSRLFSLSIALHVSLLALYVALCVVCATGVEENVRVPLESASHVQTWINLITHVRTSHYT